MEKLNYQQIAALIEEMATGEIDISEDRWMHEDVPMSLNQIDDSDDGYERLKEIYTQFGTIEISDDFGGEGQGDDYWLVYHFVDHDVYIKFEGWYASSVGSEFNEKYEVSPEQVTVTQYKRVK